MAARGIIDAELLKGRGSGMASFSFPAFPSSTFSWIPGFLLISLPSFQPRRVE
jgi:hypothetical protein